jgi:DNA-binding beta-propeller fold protein YncE
MKHAIVVLAIVGALLAVPGQAGAVALEWTSFGGPGNAPGQFDSDFGVAVAPSGAVWIADGANNRIQKLTFNLDGTANWTAIATAGTTLGAFFNPIGIAVDPSSGVVYVSDSGNNRVLKYDGSAWSQISATTGGSSGLGRFQSPQGLDVDALGDVWVADFTNKRIQKYDISANSWSQYGEAGNLGGTLTNPTDVAVFSNIVYVANSTANSVRMSTNALTGGSSADTWTNFVSGAGPANGKFNNVKGVAVDGSGNVWVTDYNNNRIQEFSPTGTGGTGVWQLTVGGTAPGSADGQFRTPNSLDVDARGIIWVADTGNNRIQASIPEPVTMAGLALGLGCLTRYIRRRRTA